MAIQASFEADPAAMTTATHPKVDPLIPLVCQHHSSCLRNRDLREPSCDVAMLKSGGPYINRIGLKPDFRPGLRKAGLRFGSF